MAKVLLHRINIHVSTCAGSGKTIAAKYAYKRLSSMGVKTIFICYNHLLGNWLRDELNPESVNGYVGTLYHFACKELGSYWNNPSWTGTSDHAEILFEKLESKEADKYKVPEERKFEALIIDEGQDFLPYWVRLLSHFMINNASVLWFKDHSQNILFDDKYDKELINMGTNIFRELTGKEQTLINDEPNYRTPQSVNKYMEVFFENYCNTFRNNNIGKSENKINGFPTKTIFYEKENLLATLENSINALIAIGVNKKNIVVVSCLPLDANASVVIIQTPL